MAYALYGPLPFIFPILLFKIEFFFPAFSPNTLIQPLYRPPLQLVDFLSLLTPLRVANPLFDSPLLLICSPSSRRPPLGPGCGTPPPSEAFPPFSPLRIGFSPPRKPSSQLLIFFSRIRALPTVTFYYLSYLWSSATSFRLFSRLLVRNSPLETFFFPVVPLPLQPTFPLCVARSSRLKFFFQLHIEGNLSVITPPSSCDSFPSSPLQSLFSEPSLSHEKMKIQASHFPPSTLFGSSRCSSFLTIFSLFLFPPPPSAPLSLLSFHPISDVFWQGVCSPIHIPRVKLSPHFMRLLPEHLIFLLSLQFPFSVFFFLPFPDSSCVFPHSLLFPWYTFPDLAFLQCLFSLFDLFFPSPYNWFLASFTNVDHFLKLAQLLIKFPPLPPPPPYLSDGFLPFPRTDPFFMVKSFP